MTNLVQFPGLGLSFELDRVAFSIGGMNIYWYGVCIAVGMCLALVFAFRHSVEFGVDADAMVDVILIGVVMGILCARLYYVALSPYQYHSLKDVLAIRDGGLAIYGGIIGAFLFGGLACKWRKVPVLPMFDLAAMGFLPYNSQSDSASITINILLSSASAIKPNSYNLVSSEIVRFIPNNLRSTPSSSSKPVSHK